MEDKTYEMLDRYGNKLCAETDGEIVQVIDDIPGFSTETLSLDARQARAFARWILENTEEGE